MKKNYLKIYYEMLDTYQKDLQIFKAYKNSIYGMTQTSRKYYDELINKRRRYISAIKKSIKNQKLLDSFDKFF